VGNLEETPAGIVFIAPRGKSPSANSISWSPTDANIVLIKAYETPAQPAEIYLLDTYTGNRQILAGPLQHATFIRVAWKPDGKKVFILSGDNTEGFEPQGWWELDIKKKSAELILGPENDASWSPDGRIIAVLRRKQMNDPRSIELLLIDNQIKTEKLIASYTNVDYTAGISWSSDGKYVVFSMSQNGNSNLFIFSAEAQQVLQITHEFGNENPTWSPKGNVIAFERNFLDKVGTYLYLISPDGKCEVEIPKLTNIWSPTWSPDGRKLGYIGRDGIFYLELEKVLGRDIYQNLCP
jgi:dipeptidyl aminopeptidase/acylaminoacyl peptidase